MNSLSKKLILAGFLVAATISGAWARPGSSFSGHSGVVGSAHYTGHGGYGGRPGWNGGWHGGGWYGGAYVGLWPFYAPYYAYGYPGAYAYDTYPDTYAVPAQAPVYVQQNGVAPAPQQAAPSGDWYYCTNPAGYYPYVKSCSVGWQHVPAKPPGVQ